MTNAVTYIEISEMRLKIISPLLKKLYIDIELLFSPNGECFEKTFKSHFQMDLN